MKAAEIRELSAEDLQVKLKEAKAELFNLRFQLATGQLQNTTVIASTKRDIARCMTCFASRNSRTPAKGLSK